MKLIGLEVVAEGSSGWGSGLLEFGEDVTQLYGANGAGKTPLVQSIVFALGYPSSFRDDIKQRCKCVDLIVSLGSRCYQFRRYFGKSFLVEVSDPLGSDDGVEHSFHSEGAFSRFIFELWGCSDPQVTSTSGAATQLYISHLLPVFFLDQDEGYSSLYFAPSKFVKDQYAEVIRSLFKLPAKNPFELRKFRREAQERLDRLDLSIVRRQRLIGQLASDVGQPRRSQMEVAAEISQVESSFNALRRGVDAKSEAQLSLDLELVALRRRLAKMVSEKTEHQARLRSYSVIENEIEIEANTLSLNEEAREVFASFESVCANQACGLFARSSESYGKSLLYLKDQLKDLARSREYHEHQISRISSDIETCGIEIDGKISRRASVSGEDGAAALVDATAVITERLISLRREFQIERQLDEEEQGYVGDLAARESAQNDLASASRGGNAVNLALLRAKAELDARLRYWLSVLHAVNMPSNVSFDSDFDVDLQSDNFRSIKGSTKTRLVLAVRTAVFEVLLKDESFSPRFFILDTPKQQDIDTNDFARYIAALKDLAKSGNAQIIFSSSNYRYEASTGDVDWPPVYSGPEQLMYLG